MLAPLFQHRRGTHHRNRERGVTMALVAVSISIVIAMAALSIDVGTLYEASTEAQRSADAAALAAARVLSLSGMTGDPTNSSTQWAAACAAARQAAISVVSQDSPNWPAPTVTFSAPDGTGCSSSGPGTGFGVNPQVTVKVANTSLPTFFARIFSLITLNSSWSSASVSGTATAEVYNPSDSTTLSSGNGTMVPVQPHCVKPLIIPNLDPLNPASCTNATPCKPFVDPTYGTIQNGGIRSSSGSTGVIGETFNLIPDCAPSGPCNGTGFNLTPLANQVAPESPNLQYVAGQVLGMPVAQRSCTTGITGTLYQQAVDGCDQTTPYQCGIQASVLASNANEVDLTENPTGATGDTATAMECLINESAEGPGGTTQDSLLTGSVPYQVQAGTSNPTGATGDITSSSSVVSVAIYDSTYPLTVRGGGNLAPVTIIGFLQVFVNYVNTDGSLNVTVLNVAGCGNTATTGTPFVTGTSPVPIRLITPTS